MKIRKKGVKSLHKTPKSHINNSKQVTFFFNHYYYNICPENIIHNKKLKRTDLLILMTIFTFYIQGRRFYQSNKRIANNLQLSKPSVINSITKLINLNYITCGFLYKKKNIVRRYIFLNAKKVLGTPDKHITKSTHTTSSKSLHKSSAATNNKPLSSNQKKLVEKSLQVIRKNVSHINLKNSKSRFINEYKNSNLNFDNLNDALIVYQYEKQIKHKSIHSNVGYICKLTQDTFNKSNIKQLKDKLINKSKSHLKQNRQETFDDYGYSKPSKSFKDKYYKKHGFEFGDTNKNVLKQLAKEYKIDFNKPFKSFRNHLNILTDKQIISSGQHVQFIIDYYDKKK